MVILARSGMKMQKVFIPPRNVHNWDLVTGGPIFLIASTFSICGFTPLHPRKFTLVLNRWHFSFFRVRLALCNLLITRSKSSTCSSYKSLNMIISSRHIKALTLLSLPPFCIFRLNNMAVISCWKAYSALTRPKDT